MKTLAIIVAVCTALAIAPTPTHADVRTLSLRDDHGDATLRLRPFGRLGRPTRRAWARIDHFLASRRGGGARRTHPRLVRSLVHLQRHFGGRPIEVLSAYRAPTDPGGPHGYHAFGRAADIRIPGVAPRDLFEACRRLPRMGCGLYPNTGFAHVDARPRPAVWIDLSTGRGSRYVDGVEAWLRAHPEAGRAPPTRPYRENPGRALEADDEVLAPPRRRTP
jgi:uncharacterized protein YcbK (DUF882 family)